MEIVERLMGITDNFVGYWRKNIFNNSFFLLTSATDVVGFYYICSKERII